MEPDQDDVRAAALRFIAERGTNAVADLRELADISATLGDHFSAETWLEIAETASRLLQRGDPA